MLRSTEAPPKDKQDIERTTAAVEEKDDDDEEDERTPSQKFNAKLKYPTRQFIDELKAMRSKPNPIVVLVGGAVMEALGHMNDWKTFLKEAKNPDKLIKEMKSLDKTSRDVAVILHKYMDNQ